MNWDDLQVFLAMMRHGSLSAAARELGVEHATIARRIGRLEASLSTRLFDRFPRGWQPTPEAVTMFEDAKTAELAMQTVARRAGQDDQLAGPVTLSAPPLLQSKLLVPALAGFVQAHPNIALTIDGSYHPRNLQDGQVDLALRIGTIEGQTLRARRLADVTYRPYRSGKTDKVILSEAKGAFYEWMRDWSGDRRVALRTEHVPSMLAAARAGLGIALLPDFLAAASDALTPVGAKVLTRPLYLTMHEDKANSPRVRLVADHLAQIILDLRPKLAP